jgi:hypothetical protein
LTAVDDDAPKDPAQTQVTDPAAVDGEDAIPADLDPFSADDETLEEDSDAVPAPGPSFARTAGFAVIRAGVVLAVAAVAYQAVVPVHHVSRARLARLVPTKPGLVAYNSAHGTGAEQPASQSTFGAMKSAAAKSPNESGVYTIGWQTSQVSGAGLAAFLYPTAAQAQVGLSQLVSGQLSASAFASAGLRRQATFTIADIGGSKGATFVPLKGGPGVSLAAFQDGRIVAADEVYATSPTQADAQSLAVNEYQHLRQVLPGFSLKYVTHPVVATALWVAGSLALAALAAFGPAGWRWRRRRRQLRFERELASRVVVGGQVIHKRRL